MSRSSELLELPGTIAAGLYSRKGFLEEYEGPFPTDEASWLAGMCSSITLTMEMQGLLLERLTGEPGWAGFYGWAAWGPESAIIAVEDSMCIVQTPPASFDAVFSAMRASADIEENETE